MGFFKKNIEYLTEKSQRTKVIIAKEMGFEYETFRTYYNKKRLDFEVLITISEYFKVSIDDLLKVNIEAKDSEKVIIYVNDIEKLAGAKEEIRPRYQPAKKAQQQTFDELLDAKIEEKVRELLNKHKQ